MISVVGATTPGPHRTGSSGARRIVTMATLALWAGGWHRCHYRSQPQWLRPTQRNASVPAGEVHSIPSLVAPPRCPPCTTAYKQGLLTAPLCTFAHSLRRCHLQYTPRPPHGQSWCQVLDGCFRLHPHHSGLGRRSWALCTPGYTGTRQQTLPATLLRSYPCGCSDRNRPRSRRAGLSSCFQLSKVWTCVVNMGVEAMKCRPWATRWWQAQHGSPHARSTHGPTNHQIIRPTPCLGQPPPPSRVSYESQGPLSPFLAPPCRESGSTGPHI